MLLLYYTHSILFYLGLPSFHANNDFKKHLHSFDFEYLPQEVCVAKCLGSRKVFAITEIPIPLYGDIKEKGSNRSMKVCLDSCASVNAINQTEGHNLPAPKQIHENYSLNLICRDDSSLNLKIDLHMSNKNPKLNANQSTELEGASSNSTPSPFTTNGGASSEVELNQHEYGMLFVIKVHLANGADKIFVYLSDDNFFTIDQLLSNTTYNISVLAVHANNKYSVIAQHQQFKTLRRSYTPGNVTEIKITHFTEDKFNRMHLIATLTWKPAADMTCHYNIICFSPESEDYDLQPLEIRNPRQLYRHQLENLTFSSVYKVGIRASNTKSMRESELFWKTFTVPSCVEWHNYNFNICAPETPQNLHIEQIILDQHVYSLNISWQLPSYLPDSYTLRIQDLSAQGEATTYKVAKDINNYFIPQIYFYGVFYEVSLTAYTRGGNATASFTDITKTVVHLPEKSPFVKLIAVILAPIFCVAILSLTVFIIYHRRAKLKRYQERCKYFEELEKKAPIEPRNNLEFTTNLKTNPNDHSSYQIEGQDDGMEIDLKDLILHQVLGEGAFGLVKLGLYKDSKLGTTQQVAVKMLKDHPSADDIYAFRREIEVMKSVEKHPNIVGLIGHCTRFSNQMMLITEYCSFGNLLNFLRDEWHFLHKLQRKERCINTDIAYIELNQGGDHSQELQAVNSLPLSIETENSKKNFQHGEDDDDNVDDVKTGHEDNDVVERFKIKYTEVNVNTSHQSDNPNSNNSTHSKRLDHHSLFQRVEDLNATTVSSDRETDTETHNISTSNVLSPAAENKSYGYDGFCTNSCKCNVDVIITNINSTDTAQQNEELERILSQQQLQQQHVSNFNKTNATSATTIQIKDCDCKVKDKYHNSANKFNGAVENKSYFKLLTSDNKYLTRKNQRNAQRSKMKHKIKRQIPMAPVTDPNENDDEVDANVNTNHLERVPLSCGDLLHIARQVAVGMEFLAKNKVVHRDLAARNVLVAPDRTIKIADFGLSRDVYQENMYKKTGNGKLPIKWLALESMTHQVYTTQSDVWSYGILLYEIVTLGATPYPSIPTNRLLHLLKSGYRMEKPKGCGQELYDLMYSCWNAEPIVRPTFNNIIQKLDEMLNCLDSPSDSPTIYSEVDKDLSQKQESIKNVTSDESYLKPL